MAKPEVAIIILHFGEQEHTLRCVRSVAEAATAAQDTCLTTTYVVDNNAAAEPLQCPDEDLGNHEIIRSISNSGFAAGMNLGIRAAIQRPCDYLWLLNNDTVVDPSSIKTLIEHAESHREQKWIGCTMLDQTNHRVTTVGGYRYSALLSAAWPIKNSQQSPDYIDGAAMLLCAATARALGGLPVDHFMYFEELHLARALERKGLSWGVCEAARVSHQGGVSTSALSLEDKTYHLTLSALRYTSQHAKKFLVTVWLTRLIKAVFDSAATFNVGGATGFARASLQHFFNRNEDDVTR